jgi:hypothetical protein
VTTSEADGPPPDIAATLNFALLLVALPAEFVTTTANIAPSSVTFVAGVV